MSEIQCRWAGSDRPRMSRGHLDECEGPCPGCEPCAERHCGVCGKQHVTVEGRGNDETCAGCISDTRTSLKAITNMCSRVLGEAIMRGVNSEAAMLAGPAADAEAWGYRRMSALAGRVSDDFLEDCRDELHPLWVLGTWEMLVREHFDQPTEARVTVTEAQRYLNEHLTRLAHDATFDFPGLATDARWCEAHMEDVLTEGEREVYGAPCIKCDKPLLRDDQDGEESWWCERCKRRSNEDQYRLAVTTAYKANANRLPAADLAERIGVPAGTIRRWAAKVETIVGTKVVTQSPLLPFVGVDSQHRKVYDVATAERLRDRKVGDAVA